ncbi:NAD(P)/FAD-dependent oxidoreductase [Streptomyces sp. CA-111067]|uniref:NAD(P)/FAD-dependent oxidoreductase n=1 Tax=Streptomyces sp. CA-111067 TaxID=3240046 RepID=UPI003D98E4CF
MAGAAPPSGPGQVGDDGPPDSRKDDRHDDRHSDRHDDREPYGRRRIAVIGSGIAGLTAAHVLCRSADVTLFEADDRVGGHAHTHDIADPAGGNPLRVDSGFIVHNARTYPYLLRLLRELDVATQESEMSMSVRCEGCGLEYAGALGPRGLFAQPRNALRPRYLRMLLEVTAFHRAARRLLAADTEREAGDDSTLRAFLVRGGFSAYFTAHFMTPLVSAVWSCSPATALDFPARYLFRFMDHHGMLSVGGSPVWRTITGGSRSYVERVTKQLAAVRTSTPVHSLRRLPGGGAELGTGDGTVERFDAAVVAVHPDQALRLLAEPTAAEREVLGAFRYTANPALLHTDTSLLPRASGARASWNHLLPSCSADAGNVLVSYDMTRLQRLPGAETYVVTLNGAERVADSRVLARMDYAHPQYTPESVAAQRRLPSLNGPVIAYAGAYHGWGFHEDGCRSGAAAAGALGVSW